MYFKTKNVTINSAQIVFTLQNTNMQTFYDLLVLPQTNLQGQDRQDCFKMFLWAQQNKHGTPGRDMWTGSTGLGGPAGIESAAISGGQRRSGGH